MRTRNGIKHHIAIAVGALFQNGLFFASDIQKNTDLNGEAALHHSCQGGILQVEVIANGIRHIALDANALVGNPKTCHTVIKRRLRLFLGHIEGKARKRAEDRCLIVNLLQCLFKQRGIQIKVVADICHAVLKQLGLGQDSIVYTDGIHRACKPAPQDKLLIRSIILG